MSVQREQGAYNGIIQAHDAYICTHMCLHCLLVHTYMTDCLVSCSWDMSVQRERGECNGVVLGLGSCCTQKCFNSKPLSNTSCICDCSPGFVGQECDSTANHVYISLLVLNKTRADWVAENYVQIGKNQPYNQFILRGGTCVCVCRCVGVSMCVLYV